jgi:hypothetical protein
MIIYGYTWINHGVGSHTSSKIYPVWGLALSPKNVHMFYDYATDSLEMSKKRSDYGFLS